MLLVVQSRIVTCIPSAELLSLLLAAGSRRRRSEPTPSPPHHLDREVTWVRLKVWGSRRLGQHGQQSVLARVASVLETGAWTEEPPPNPLALEPGASNKGARTTSSQPLSIKTTTTASSIHRHTHINTLVELSAIRPTLIECCTACRASIIRCSSCLGLKLALSSVVPSYTKQDGCYSQEDGHEGW